MNYRNFICGALLFLGCVASRADVTISCSGSGSGNGGGYCMGDNVTLTAVDDNPPKQPKQSKCCKAGGGTGTWSLSADYVWTGASGSGATAALDSWQPGPITATVTIDYTWTCSEGGTKTSSNSGSVDVPVSDLQISDGSAFLRVGESQTFTAEGGVGRYKWKSSDVTVATIDPDTGEVYAVGLGEATITVTDEAGCSYETNMVVGDVLPT